MDLPEFQAKAARSSEPTHEIFSYKSFRQPPDCPTVPLSQSGFVSMRAEAIITRQDKVDVLQRLDPRWPSLDHKVCCTHCGKVFAASEIAVLGGSRGFGPLRLHCPNEACKATPRDWISARHNFLVRQSPSRQTGRVLTTHKGRVFRVRRPKLVRRRDEMALPGIGSFSHFMATTLRQLNPGWGHLWRRTIERFRIAGIQ
jgi:hypothetical protein